ncbi:hypothetical protein Pflav_072720 [Phytohabitans flavus]|uniref:Aldehyde oxidase/xanthine dehydrogenase a/b hammerhead domain-containing protein n=1 Tax=Phytohabitans flavus TaxID=1076124 RepID=A0A6F8Y422_9ACTN|nr:molybdopterin cofactor-binding domain-containing protein [Phytohabitans flavus]BCB80862.1 hypothetical protein Pflav_072720 [Phytohabitans flavus]
MSVVGTPVDRVDGQAKVTGGARYTAEVVLPDLAYATIVGATIPSGRIRRIDTDRALVAGGVLAVLTHENLPKIAEPPHLLPSLVGAAAPGESFFPMQDDVVHYAGQPVALVVADSHERAQWAASLVEVEYERTPSITTLDEGRGSAYEPQMLFGGLLPARMAFGDVDAGLADAEVRVDVSYHFAANHHNALETSATTAAWEGDRLTLYDSTMGIRATQLTVAHLLGLQVSDVRVITHFVGGGFGGKAMTWPHVTLAAMAARQVDRPVRLMLTRTEAFTSTGHREEQEQALSLGAKRDGTLTAVRHHKLALTSQFDDWAEPATNATLQLYTSPNVEGVHRLVKGNTMTATFTRGPGETVGVFVLETAMDELAYTLGVDPVELRLRCHGDTDPRATRGRATDWRSACG